MKLPDWPDRIGKKGESTTPDGIVLKFIIEDEIRHKQSNYPHKVLYLQKLRFTRDNSIEYRFGYYIIGKKPKMKGKWVWGQFAPTMPKEDFVEIIKQATQKGWI